jgi:hypothetical protein
MADTKPESVKTCIKCGITKDIKLCLKTHNVCNDCNNLKRREKYKNNEDLRKKLISKATETKQKHAQQRNKIKEAKLKELEDTIGSENTICKYCEEVRPKTRFRHNRLKCKDCERDEPLEKLKRLIRSRIFAALKFKQKHTIEYLGCSTKNYINWLLYNNNGYNLENRGTEWHIDHVIPLSLFDLDDEKDQLIAFNWRNTMPLSPAANLSKNNKIIPHQIEEHLENLKEFHKENNIVMPQIYIDLFAKHLDAGNPLEPLLPPANGNISGELG